MVDKIKASRVPLELIVCLCLAITTLAVFSEVRNHQFVNYDDNRYVTENRVVQAGLTREGAVWAFTTTHASNWHPLTWLSHMLDCELFGANPRAHHLSNLILHLANSLLLFLIFKRMTGMLWQSAFVAALFAIHPLHVESVAWVSERKDVLSAFFLMLTLWAYLYYVVSPGFGRYLLVLLLFAIGLMAKPMLVTLPFVLLLMDYWPLGRFQLASRRDDSNPNISKSTNLKGQPRPPLGLVSEKLPLLAVSALSSLATFLVQQSEAAVQSLAVFPLEVRVANALMSYMTYVGKTIWPRHLAVFYPHPGHVAFWKIAGAVLFLVGVSTLVIRKARRHPYLATGWLWYLGTLVPVIGLVQVGAQSMADRYTYVPSIGLFVMIAWGAPHLMPRRAWRHVVIALSTGSVLLALMVTAWLQVRHWHDSRALFEHAIKVTHENALAHHNLGMALYRQGRVGEAIAQYRKAMAINSNYALAHNSLGAALVTQGGFKEAITHFSRALQINPHYDDAQKNLRIALKQTDKSADGAEAHNHQGIVLVSEGRLEEAVAEFSEALRLRPRFAEAHYNMGNVLSGLIKLDEAIAHYLEAVRIRPGYAEAHNNLGIALAQQGKAEEATNHFSHALQIRPSFSEARNNLIRLQKTAPSP